MGGSISVSTTPAAANIVDGYHSIVARSGKHLLTRSATEKLVINALQLSPIVLLLARSGQGKSTLIAQILSRQEIQSKWDVMHSVFVGSVEGSTILFRILTDLCLALYKDLKMYNLWKTSYEAALPITLMGLVGLFTCLLEELSNDKKKVLICFDALNELDGATARLLTFIPQKSSATFLLTTIMNPQVEKNEPRVAEVLLSLTRRFPNTSESIVLPDLNEDEQQLLISSFASIAKGELNKAVINSLRTKTGKTSPLYLKLAAPYLDMLASDSTFPTDIPSLYDWLLDRLLRSLPGDTGGLNVKLLMTAIAVSNGGLYSRQLLLMQEQLQEDLTLNLVGTVSFRRLLAHFLRATPIKKSKTLSRIGFVHMQADYAIRRRWLSSSNNRIKIHQLVLEFLLKQYDNKSKTTDEDKRLEWNSVLSGLPRHLLGVGDRMIAKKWTCTARYCQEKLRTGHLAELIQDFRLLDKRWQSDVFSDFLELLKANSHVLRTHPQCFYQQALNSRHDSAARQNVLNDRQENVSNSMMLLWKNKFNGKPSNISTFESRSLLFWCVDVFMNQTTGQTIFAAGGSDGCVHLLDVDGNETAILPAHADDVDHVKFSPITSELLISSASGPDRHGTEVFLYNTHTCTRLGVLVRPYHVYSIRWNAIGDRICFSQGSGFVIVKVEVGVMMEEICHWNQPEREKNEAAEGNEEEEEEEEEEDDGYGACHCCCFASSSSTLVAVGTGAFITVVETTMGIEHIATKLDGRHEESIETVDWCRDNDLIASGALDSTIRLWSWKQKKCLRKICVHEDVVHCVRFSYNLNTISLLSSSEDRQACEIEISSSYKCVARLRGHSSGVRSIQPIKNQSPKGLCYCVTVGDDASIRCWDLNRAKIQTSNSLFSGKPITATIWLIQDESKKIVVCGDSKGTLTAFEEENCSMIWSTVITLSINSHSAITDLRANKPHRKVGVASMFRRCVTFSAMDGSILRALDAEDWINVCGIGTNKRGEMFVVGGGDASTMFVWWEKKEVFHLSDNASANSSNVLALELCPTNPTLLAVGGNGRQLTLWQLETDKGVRLASSCLMNGWIVSCSFCKERSDLVVVCIAGKKGCLCLMKYDERNHEIKIMTEVLSSASLSWCGVTSNGLIVSAAATKLLHVFEVDAECFVLKNMCVFGSKGRFGSPDGIGGSGDLISNELAIGDEAGMLYLLEIR